MNEEIRNELLLILNVFEKTETDKQVKIISMLSKILDNKIYTETIKKELEAITSIKNFDITVDFTRLILSVLNVNSRFEFQKEISVNKMKYIIYGIIYNNFVKNDPNILNNIDITKFRILYYNAINLMLLPPENLKIKTNSFWEWLFGDICGFRCFKSGKCKL